MSYQLISATPAPRPTGVSAGSYVGVLIVVAILAAVVAAGATFLIILQMRPALNHDEHARIETQALIDSLETALEEYRFRNDAYPADQGDRPWSTASLVEELEAAGLYEFEPHQLWEGELVDAWGVPMRYRVGLGRSDEECQELGVRNPEGYDLWSTGPDATDDTPDDIQNYWVLKTRPWSVRPQRAR